MPQPIEICTCDEAPPTRPGASPAALAQMQTFLLSREGAQHSCPCLQRSTPTRRQYRHHCPHRRYGCNSYKSCLRYTEHKHRRSTSLLSSSRIPLPPLQTPGRPKKSSSWAPAVFETLNAKHRLFTCNMFTQINNSFQNRQLSTCNTDLWHELNLG